jgi:hypothetical protein
LLLFSFSLSASVVFSSEVFSVCFSVSSELLLLLLEDELSELLLLPDEFDFCPHEENMIAIASSK